MARTDGEWVQDIISAIADILRTNTQRICDVVTSDIDVLERALSHSSDGSPAAD